LDEIQNGSDFFLSTSQPVKQLYIDMYLI